MITLILTIALGAGLAMAAYADDKAAPAKPAPDSSTPTVCPVSTMMFNKGGGCPMMNTSQADTCPMQKTGATK